MNKINLARELAEKAHAGQLRDDGKPYITHPKAVANLLFQVTKNEDVICAALLHDVIEDTSIGYNTIKAGFGKRVADLVKEVSKDKDGNFHIQTREGAMIKLADTLHNLSNASAEKKSGYIKKKIAFMQKFINAKGCQEEAKEMLKFYEEHDI